MQEDCKQNINRLIINAGKIIRQLKALPPETDITKIYNETAPLLGFETQKKQHPFKPNKETTPITVKPEKIIIPRKDCPACNLQETMQLFDLCRGCHKDTEFKSAWKCLNCGHQEKSQKPFTVWLTEMKVDFPSGFKKDLGINKLP